MLVKRFRRGNMPRPAWLIWDKFNGKNHQQLVRDYDISIQWLYKIIKYQRAADIKRRQVDVFD